MGVATLVPAAPHSARPAAVRARRVRVLDALPTSTHPLRVEAAALTHEQNSGDDGDGVGVFEDVVAHDEARGERGAHEKETGADARGKDDQCRLAKRLLQVVAALVTVEAAPHLRERKARRASGRASIQIRRFILVGSVPSEEGKCVRKAMAAGDDWFNGGVSVAGGPARSRACVRHSRLHSNASTRSAVSWQSGGTGPSIASGEELDAVRIDKPIEDAKANETREHRGDEGFPQRGNREPLVERERSHIFAPLGQSAEQAERHHGHCRENRRADADARWGKSGERGRRGFQMKG
eukprot:4009569-Pleurochrysis_carterae.AAC.1